MKIHEHNAGHMKVLKVKVMEMKINKHDAGQVTKMAASPFMLKTL